MKGIFLQLALHLPINFIIIFGYCLMGKTVAFIYYRSSMIHRRL